MIDQEKEKAPLFKSWGYWYVLMLVFLLLLIVLFTMFTKRFA